MIVGCESNPGDTRDGAGRARHWKAISALAGLTVLAYAGIFHGPFVFDDIPAILENPSIRHLWPISDVLMPLSGGTTVAGRPLLNLSLAVNQAISGTAPWSYHVVNVVIHLCAGLVLFGICRRTLTPLQARDGRTQRTGLTPETVAFFAAALWLVHPLQTEAVTYTVQRAESLMGLFYLLTLYGFLRATAPRTTVRELQSRPSANRMPWLLGSIAACACGMATKEVMATAPVLVLLYDRTFVAGTVREALRRRAVYYVALGATWGILTLLILSTGGNRGGTVGFGVNVPLWAYPLTQFQAVARYLGLGVWPSPLVFEYGAFWVQRSSDILPYAVIVLPLLVLAIVAMLRRPVVGFIGGWFFLILIPTTFAPSIVQMIVEHRLYLSLAAITTLGVVAVHHVLGRRATPVFAATLVAFVALTARRNHDYRTPFALWTDTVAKRPDNPRAHSECAEALSALGRINDVTAERREAVRLEPDESQYHYNLAVALAEAHRAEEAIKEYEISLRLDPEEPNAHNNLAGVLVAVGRAAEALPHYAFAEVHRPNDAMIHHNHGLALIELGRTKEAIQEFEAALKLQPDSVDAHFNLGSALIQVGRTYDGLKHLARAVELQPSDVTLRTAYGRALLAAGQVDEAEYQFHLGIEQKRDAADAWQGLAMVAKARGDMTKALELTTRALGYAPNDANLHRESANLLVATGELNRAMAEYETTLRLAPNDAEAHHNLGTVYARFERYTEARREFETALRLQPDNAEAARHLEQVRQIIEQR